MKDPKNLFIDTNVFLSFYHFTKDDLEELDKLAVLLDNKEIRLFLPKQVEEEFRRNREVKIADALKRLRDQKLNLQFPQISKGYEGYNKLRSLQKEYEKEHQDLLETLHSDAKSNKLKADKTIHDLFKLAEKIDVDEVVEAAKLRVERGNPPGKSGSLGDAINWEALIEYVKDGEDIYFITDDKDYSSALGEDEFSEFLLSEWTEVKGSSLFFYRLLSDFFKDHFPNIKLASELRRDVAVRSFASSESFSDTHAAIARLRKLSDFTPSQLEALAEAAVSNNQIYWISADTDVRSFLEWLVREGNGKVQPTLLTQVEEILEPDAPDPDWYPEELYDIETSEDEDGWGLDPEDVL